MTQDQVRASEREQDLARLASEPTDEGNIPGRPSAGAAIVIIALVAGLIYFGVSRTVTPGIAPSIPTPMASR